MNAAVVAAHVLSVVHGIVAALACLGAFWIVGLALVPRRWLASLGSGPSAVVLGAAIYVLVCWFGIELGVGLTRLALGFLAVVLALAVARRRRLLHAVGPRWMSSGAASSALAFAGFYVLAYLFTLPPATSDYLPVAWTGNIDLLTYVRYTQYLERLGPSNVAGFSYLNFVYLQTPAVFYLLGWLSMLFGQDPLGAAMPAQFALTALVATMVARISRSVFSVSPSSALAIGAVAVSAPFFRYVAGAYFLSTLMATPVLLYLLWTTLEHRATRGFDVTLAIRFAGAYILLLFMYPFLLFAGLVAQAGAVGLMFVASGHTGEGGGRAWREAGRHAIRTASAMLAPLGLLAIGFHERVSWSIEMVRSLSRTGVAGWPLDLISPLAMLGVPGAMTDRHQCGDCPGIEIRDPAHRAWALAGFCAIALALVLLYFVRFRHRTSPAARALVGLAGGAFLAYCAYFLLVGPSYQQWKFASYTALPFAFVVIAGGWQLWHESAAFERLSRAPAGGRLARGLLLGVPAALVAGNLLVHALRDPVLLRFPGALRNIAQVDRLPFPQVSIWMSDASVLPTWVALYFLPSKRVHVISPHFRPSEPLSFDQISAAWPLLIQDYGCEGVGHDDTVTVEGIGCLLLAPPSLAEDVAYPFSDSFLFVEHEGLSMRESTGRWNARPSVRLTLTADPKRVRVGRDLYVNLRLAPFVPDGAPGQRLVLSWGDAQHAEYVLTKTTEISLPVGPDDWDGNRLWTLSIAIDLPDAVAGLWLNGRDGRYREERPLAVMFEELSISGQPRGAPPVSGQVATSPAAPDAGPSRLPAQDDVEAGEQEVELRARELAGALRQDGLVERDHLRHVGDRVVGQARDARGQEGVARRVGPFEIAGERHAHNRGQPATVERIALHDHDRSPEAGPRSDRRRKLGPPDLALRDHHSVLSRTSRPAAATKPSSSRPTSSQTRSMASVTSSGAWRATYSRRAALYTSLRDRPPRRASRSARSYTSSGIETAVFIPGV